MQGRWCTEIQIDVLQLAMGWDVAGFTEAAAAALEEGTAERNTLALVASARGLAMPA